MLPLNSKLQLVPMVRPAAWKLTVPVDVPRSTRTNVRFTSTPAGTMIVFDGEPVPMYSQPAVDEVAQTSEMWWLPVATSDTKTDDPALPEYGRPSRSKWYVDPPGRPSASTETL